MRGDSGSEFSHGLPDYLRVIRRELSSLANRLHDPARVADTISMATALLDNLVVLLEDESVRAAARDGARTRRAETIGEVRRDLERIERLIQAEARSLRDAADPDGPTPERVREYLVNRQGGGADISVNSLTAPLGGYSKSTCIVRLGGRDRPVDAFVLRLDTPGGPIGGSVVDEHEVLRAMADGGVPVPEPLWTEADPAIFGAPCLAVKLLPGVPAMNFRQDLQVASAADLALQFAAVLAAIHRVDARTVGSHRRSAPQRVEDHVSTLLDGWEAQWHRRGGGDNPIVSTAFQRMRSMPPQVHGAPTVVHGDATLRNVMVDGERISGLLDWETWHLGDPAEDLAYCREEMEQFVCWTEFMRAYRDHGGAPIEESRLAYWSLWKYLRGCVTSISLSENVRRDPRCDLRTAFGGIHYTRYCLQKVAAGLESV